jgi:MobA/MobL family.
LTIALFHFHVTQIKRSTGQSAVAAAAYRSGEKLHSEYYGEDSDYTRKGGVICSEILLPAHAPQEYADRETLWNAVEKVERGKKAQLAYSFDIALQNEFSMEENINLARQFLLEQFVRRGMIVDFAVHSPDKEDGGISNPHFHVMCPIRPIEPNGKWGNKQRREYVLDEDGNRIPDGTGDYVFNAVPTTDWGSPETLEHWRQTWAELCYQLSHIRNGKSHIQKSLAVWKPEMERYAGLVQQIKEKSKERKSLVAEKKELPVYRVMRHKALAVRITELTEDLEELRSEKSLLLQKFEYAEDAGAEAFRKDIATMEAGLKKLEAQEQKYSAELDKALAEYADLKAQAADFDPMELYAARQAIRLTQEKAAERQLKDSNFMQEKPSLVMLLNAKQEASRLLGGDAEERQARQMIMRRRSTEQLKRSHLKTDRCKIER